ncbi:MAG: TRAP transporter fused permease subunit [Pseudomonadota bacterium]
MAGTDPAAAPDGPGAPDGAAAPGGASASRTERVHGGAVWALALLTTLIPIGWALDIPQRLRLLLYPEQLAGLVLGLAAAGVFLRDATAGGHARRTVSLALTAAALWLGGHIFWRFPVLSENAFYHPDEALALGILTLLVVVEALRRVAGLSLAMVLALLVLYALFSDLVPGRLQGRPVPWDEILRFLGTDSTATLGLPVQVATFTVILFILFGRLLVATGGAEVLTDAARALAGRQHGATAKMAVIASGFMGSISGSAVSNVMSTGVVTIPAMRRSGLSPPRAGAIEAVASTGGQIMPPVMGAAAFLMAENLQMAYGAIILAALIPSALFFYAVYLQIGLTAQKLALGSETSPVQAQSNRPWRDTLAVAGPMAVLLGGLFLFNMPAGEAVVWATATLALIGLAGRARRRIGGGAVLRALFETGRDAAQILMICAVAGMIMGLLQTSGLAFGLSFVLLDLGKGSLTALLVLTAAVSILLGMGLPTSGVYLLLAALAAPPLIRLGIGPLEAHFFVLYFGLLSMITPPVALAAFAAASIAGAGAMRTAWESLRLGWIAFLLPFIFVGRPGLLMQGDVWSVLGVTAAVVIAVPLITAAIVGYGRTRLGPGARALAALLGLVALLPQSGQTGAAALAAAALGLALILFHLRRAQLQHAP